MFTFSITLLEKLLYGVILLYDRKNKNNFELQFKDHWTIKGNKNRGWGQGPNTTVLCWSHQTLLRRSMPRFAVKGSSPAGNLKGVKCEDFTPFIIY